MKLLLLAACFIDAASAQFVNCDVLDTYTFVELGGDNVSVVLRCTHDFDDSGEDDVQVEIAALDTAQNHQILLKQWGPRRPKLRYDTSEK